MSRDRETSPHVEPLTDSAELDLALEDAGGLSAFGFQKQAPIRLSSSPMLQSVEAIQAFAALGLLGAQWRDNAQFALTMLLASLGAKSDSPFQSLVAAVDSLVGVPENQFFASLTDGDYQGFVAVRDKLIDVVGEDENHLFAPLIDFIGNLIEKYEEESDMSIRKPRRPARRPERRGRPANRPRLKLADLLPPEAANAASLRPHRSEKVGRPANRPRLKLADLLAQETDNTAHGEVDTGPPVGKEIW